MRTARSAAFVMLLALGAWAGGDPWKEKPYQQWDAKDCQKIMYNSPWAQIVVVDATWQPLSSGSGLPPSRDGANRSMGGPGEGGSQAAPGLSDSSQPAQSSITQFVIRWVSSRTEREAAVRSAILEGRIKESEADKFLAAAPDEFQLLVAGRDMTPFNGVDAKSLQRNTFLHLKKSGAKIAPIDIQFQRNSSDQRVTTVLFAFPKKLASGEPFIGTEEKVVEFVCHLGKTTLKTNFDVQKMSDKQGQDL
jgi:hypothetical protein